MIHFSRTIKVYFSLIISLFNVFVLEYSDSIGKLHKPASLRPSKEDDDNFNILRTTPEFQKHIAKHLTNLLDKKLGKKIKLDFSEQNLRKKQRVGGIKLFSDSKYYLDSCGDEIKVFKKDKYPKKYKQLITEEQLQNLAVSGETIIQKKDTKHWSNRTKGKVFFYKKNNHGEFNIVE